MLKTNSSKLITSSSLKIKYKYFFIIRLLVAVYEIVHYFNSMTAPFLICVGNAIVDILVKVEDSFLKSNDLIKGSMSLVNNEEFIYKDLSIKSIKCTDSKFDDNPEVKAYIQVKDLTKKDRNNVFVFNGWMFSSSPSIAPFDHPVYDIWLVNCY